MKRIYLIRHGDAEDYDPARHAGDPDRALTDAGRRELALVARRLARVDPNIEIVLSSPLLRARETAEIIAFALSVRSEDFAPLDPPLSATRLLDEIRRRREARLALVGHEPGLGRAIAEWIGARENTTPMRKAGIACLRASADRQDFVLLDWFAPPDIIINTAT